MGGGLIPTGSVPKIADSSIILTVIFSALYGIPCDSIAPTLDDIRTAIRRMPCHGVDPKALILKDTPLYTLLMAQHTPYHPLKVYSIAARYSMESLAKAASSHLLNLGVGDVDDAYAVEMGPLYLKRLMLLNTHRIAALKRIVLSSPASHPLTKACTAVTQKDMRKEWLCTVAKLTWDVKPSLPSQSVLTSGRKLTITLLCFKGISPHLLKESCRLAGKPLSCKTCQQSWNARADDIAIQWAAVEFTI